MKLKRPLSVAVAARIKKNTATNGSVLLVPALVSPEFVFRPAKLFEKMAIDGQPFSRRHPRRKHVFGGTSMNIATLIVVWRTFLAPLCAAHTHTHT